MANKNFCFINIVYCINMNAKVLKKCKFIKYNHLTKDIPFIDLLANIVVSF